MSLNIFSVPTYKISPELIQPIAGEISDILKLLKEDKQYHERLVADSILKLNIDLDGYDIDDFRDKFTEFMLSLGIDLARLDYKYTSNNNNNHYIIIDIYLSISS